MSNERRVTVQITITTSPMGEAEAQAYALTLTESASVIGQMAGCDATVEISGYLVQDGSPSPQARIEQTLPRAPRDPNSN